MSEICTIILRFRDLAVSDTIKEHRSIIEKSSYCWWGWWNKPQEQLPCSVFAELNKKSKNGGLILYLFNSGRKSIYKAKCSEIKFSTDMSEIVLDGNELEKIPAYYRTQKYLAWFKFESIDHVDDFPLDKYSYINIEDFFVDHKNAFQAFNNKKVCSKDELYFQQRTIWFVREFRPEDSITEINLMSEHSATPENYDEYFKQLNTDSILWLSDLHFSQNHHAFGHSKIQSDSLQLLLHDQISEKYEPPSAIIVSGDLTYMADKTEFEGAEKFLRDVDSFYDIDPYCLAVCPGNHDFSFSNDPEIQLTTDESSKSYREFYKNIFNCEPSTNFSSIRRFLTKSLVPIEIISLNSVALQQIEVCENNVGDNKKIVHRFTGLGYVGVNQIREVEEKLKKTNNTNAIRILVIHHHIVPVLEIEEPMIDTSYSLILDAGAVINFIFKNNISIVLHGHSHKHSFRRISNTPTISTAFECNIIGLGSTSASANELSEGDPNMFGILTFGKDELSIKKLRVKKKDTCDDLICEHIIPLRRG